MPYCSNCGSKLRDGDRFCKNCGRRVADERGNANAAGRRTVWEGEIHKCPNCGAVLPALAASCPQCGYEIRDVDAGDAVQGLCRRLEEIEASGTSRASRKKNKETGLSIIDEQKISLIKSYPIPNTKADLVDFITLALSNSGYDCKESKKVSKAEKALAAAWRSKADQAYLKAQAVLKDEPEFESIQNLYYMESEAGERQEREAEGKIGILALVLLAAMSYLFLAAVLFI